MSRVDQQFRDRIFDYVSRIPRGQVMTYGQLAALAGAAWAAWEVGQIAHYGPDKLPWQRVVNKKGGLAKGYPGGLDGHKAALQAEGVEVDEDYRVAIDELLWWPPKK